MSKVKTPEYASEVPYVPVNWQDRDAIVGRLMGILEAVMPEGRQLEATKDLVKKSLSDHFHDCFNNQFDELIHNLNLENSTGFKEESPQSRYYRAIWLAAQTETK